jgi:ankyrin repeat protein
MNRSLVAAIKKGDIEQVRDMIAKDRFLLKEASGALVLAEAVETENIDIVRLLIELGAEVNDEDKIMYDNETSLSRACYKGNLEIVRLLLDSGAWTDTERNDYEYWNPLLCAASSGNIEIVKLLVERGANVDVIRDGGNTALSIAKYGNHQNIVEYLTTLTTIDIEEIMSRDYNKPCDT